MTQLTKDCHDTLILDGALSAIGRMMTLPLANAAEVATARTDLEGTVAEALSRTSSAAGDRRAILLGIEARVDDIPAAADEAAFAIWDIARDAFRFSSATQKACSESREAMSA